MIKQRSWVLILAAVSLLLSACTPSDNSPSPQLPEGELPGTGTDDLRQIGQTVYMDNCASCHMEDGQGQLPNFPALDGNEFVMGDPQPVIEVVLHGRGAMPPFGGILTDEEVAGVVTYIRSAWTNIAAPVEPQAVQSIR